MGDVDAGRRGLVCTVRQGKGSQGHGKCACWGKKEKSCKRARVQGCPGQGSYSQYPGGQGLGSAGASTVVRTAVRTHRLAGVRGMVYLQQRGRMQELGGSCERRVAEWPSDD